MVESKDTKTKPAAGAKRRRRGEQVNLPMKYVLIAAVVVIALIVVLLSTVLKSHSAGPATPGAATSSKNASSQDAQRTTPSGGLAAPRITSAPGPMARAHSATPAPSPAPASGLDRSGRPDENRNPAGGGSLEITGIMAGSALIGTRTVHVGDDIGGCVIKDISDDRVLVEHAGSTYNLSVGDKLP
jgi:hypothetical protein